MLKESKISTMVKESFGVQKSGWIGIDIGSDSIKIAQVKKHVHNWELLNYQILNLPIASSDSQETSKDSIDLAIQSLEKKPHLFSLFKGRKAACLFPMSVAQLLSVEVPDGNHAELKMMIEQDLQMQDSESIEDDQFIYWKEDFTRANQNGMIHASVVKSNREKILQFANHLMRSSIHCHLMSALPLAIAKAISLREETADQGVQAGFVWSNKIPLFTMVKDGVPIFSRVFRNCGFENISQILQDRMGLNYQEAIQILSSSQNSAQSPEMQKLGKAVFDMIAPSLNALSKEFKKTIAYIQQKRHDLYPEKMWLFGSGAVLSDVESTLTKMTGMKTALWSLPMQEQNQGHDFLVKQAQLGAAIAMSTMAYEI